MTGPALQTSTLAGEPHGPVGLGFPAHAETRHLTTEDPPQPRSASTAIRSKPCRLVPRRRARPHSRSVESPETQNSVPAQRKNTLRRTRSLRQRTSRLLSEPRFQIHSSTRSIRTTRSRWPRSALSTLEPSILARTDQATSCCPTPLARTTFEPGPHPRGPDFSPIGRASDAGSDTAPAPLLAPLLAALPTRLARTQLTVPPYRQTSILHRSTHTRRPIK